MSDLLMLILVAVSFAAAMAYVWACEGMAGGSGAP